MKYLLISDVHLSDKAPSSCTDLYLDDLFDLLAQCVKLARERHVIAVVIAGDLFHLKAPNRTSHALIQRLIAVLRSFSVPVFVVPGNHDIRNDRLDSISETQPLGVIFQSGAALRLEGWGGYDAHAQYMLYGVPWLQGYGSFDEADECPPAEQEVAGVLLGYLNVQSSGYRRSLVVAHAPLYPPGQELSYEYFPAVRWAEAMGGRGYVFYGHVHEPHGTWEAAGVTFCNNGALSRGSLHEYNLTRQVGCTLWDDETGEFEFVPLRARPSDQVFRLAERDAKTDMAGVLDSFLEDLTGQRLDVLSVESVLAYIQTLKLGPEAEGIAEELLAEAAHRRK